MNIKNSVSCYSTQLLNSPPNRHSVHWHKSSLSVWSHSWWFVLHKHKKFIVFGKMCSDFAWTLAYVTFIYIYFFFCARVLKKIGLAIVACPLPPCSVGVWCQYTQVTQTVVSWTKSQQIQEPICYVLWFFVQMLKTSLTIAVRQIFNDLTHEFKNSVWEYQHALCVWSYWIGIQLGVLKVWNVCSYVQ